MKRLSDQGGFTLPELMLSLAIGLIIIIASLSVLGGATRRNDELQRRTSGLQQGRAAMDDVIRTLRSQVCVKPDAVTILPPVAAASGASITLHADFGDGTGLPEKHTIALSADGTLTDTEVAGAGTADATTFTGTPRTRVIGQRISADGTTPVFEYFGFDTATPPKPDQALNSSAEPTVAAADLPRIARVVVRLQANPEGKPNPKLVTRLEDQIYVRLADPDDSAPTPKCT